MTCGQQDKGPAGNSGESLGGTALRADTSRILLALALGTGLILAAQTWGEWFNLKWYVSTLWLVPPLIFLWRRREDTRGPIPDWLRPGLILLFLIVPYLLSNVSEDHWFYLVRWFPGTDWVSLLWSSPPAQFFILTALLIPVMLKLDRVGLQRLLLALLVIIQLFCVLAFLSQTRGMALFQDDHPSFLFRFWAFARAFPMLTFYSPFWNGGYLDPSILTSGMTPVGLVFYPLLRIFPPHQIQNLMILLLFIFLVPATAYLAVKTTGGKRTAALIGALLALGVSQSYFLWMLYFGTLGASFSLPMLMLVCACLYSLLWREGKGWILGAALVLSGSIYLVWPPAFILALPVLLALALNVSRLIRVHLRFLLICGGLIFIICLPIALGIFHNYDLGVYHRLDTRSLTEAFGWGSLRAGWIVLISEIRRANFLLVFLGLAGVWFLPQRGMKIFFGTILVGLALLTGWGMIWKPQYELSRARFPMMFISILPASLWLESILDVQRNWMAPFRALAVAIIILCGVNTVLIYGNRGRVEKYKTIPEETMDLAGWLKENVPEDGRVLFAGPSRHNITAGHVAYLPVLSEREMMALDFYHIPPKKAGYDYPPRPFRDSPEGIYRFMDLYNITHVITSNRPWEDHLGKSPERYRPVRRFGEDSENTVYQAMRENSSLFYRGSGSVRSDINRLIVELEGDFEEVVLRYNWVEGLETDGQAVIYPFELGEGLRFIAVQPDGLKTIDIRY